MNIIGIETSCDETAVAIIHRDEVLADLIRSQDEIHAPYGGVVPELASRRHLEVLPVMLEQALKQSALEWKDIDGIAVTYGPGLLGALLVGLSYAKAVAYARHLPLIGVNHLEAHLLVAMMESSELHYPFLGLVVSGGHTSLYLVRAYGEYKLLGATRDDAAGEAFDKAAKLLGLGYPGGRHLELLAQKGNSTRAKFSRPRMKVRGSRFEIGPYDFSFSGLKAELSRRVGREDPADLAAGFQELIVKEIIYRLSAAATETGCRQIVVAGGVAANQELRRNLRELEVSEGLSIFIPSLRHCTDNALMVAWAGYLKMFNTHSDDMSLNAVATEELGTVA